jgi:hypothetical protein
MVRFSIISMMRLASRSRTGWALICRKVPGGGPSASSECSDVSKGAQLQKYLTVAFRLGLSAALMWINGEAGINRSILQASGWI